MSYLMRGRPAFIERSGGGAGCSHGIIIDHHTISRAATGEFITKDAIAQITNPQVEFGGFGLVGAMPPLAFSWHHWCPSSIWWLIYGSPGLHEPDIDVP